jgi:NitT/TauT family transport system permease protein
MTDLGAAASPGKNPMSLSELLVDSWAARIVLPVLTMALVLLGWELACDALAIPAYLMPKPSEFLWRFYTEFSTIASQMWATGKVILMAFGIGGVIGVTLGYLIATFPALERGAYPLIVFLEIIPKTITAPLFVTWFGVGVGSKLILTTFIAFFPILVNGIAGFRSIDPRLYYLTRSAGATWWQTFIHVQFPAALPHIFAGLKIASVYAVTAAIVIEFVGSTEGLGHLIVDAMAYMDMDLMFAAILATALTGLIFNLLVTSGERIVMPWLRYRDAVR